MEYEDQKLQDVKDVLATSKTGRLLLDFAAAHGTRIRFTDDNEKHKAAAMYWPGENLVELGKYDDIEKLAASLGHELTHAWQDSTGLLQFKPDNAAGAFFHARMIEAVAHGVQQIIAQELKLAHLPKPVQSALSSHLTSSAFRKGFNKMSGRLRDGNDRMSKRRYKISDKALRAPLLDQQIADLQHHTPEIIDTYGKMPSARNILQETGGLNKKQSSNIFAPVPKL